MKKLLHKINTEIKYLYPCSSHSEYLDDGKIKVTTETKMSKIFPIKLSVKGMKNLGKDFWGLETFVDENNKYYCALDGEVYFKGDSKEGEPHYPTKNELIMEFPKSSNKIDFSQFLNKVKEYISKNDLDLVSSNFIVKGKGNLLENIIICEYILSSKHID